MNLNLINSNISYKADTRTTNPMTGEYRDPLMKWPLRGTAFTNEVGEALRPIIGKYATLSWAPALLYIGADIYDKYKNDQTEYSPNSRRCLKQACFQGLASILLPIVAIKGGQNIFSLFGLATKEKITFNTQEKIIKLAQQFVANGKMHVYDKKDAECINDFLDIVDNHCDSNKSMTSTLKNKLRNFFNPNSKEKIDVYAENIIKTLIQNRKDLLNPTQEFKTNSPLYFKLKRALEDGQSKNVGIKTVLNQYLTKKTMNGRFVKTFGGFLALGSSIGPIDKFVEHILIDKYIGPTLDKTKKPVK